jgi:hypothetical protein
VGRDDRGGQRAPSRRRPHGAPTRAEHAGSHDRRGTGTGLAMADADGHRPRRVLHPRLGGTAAVPRPIRRRPAFRNPHSPGAAAVEGRRQRSDGCRRVRAGLRGRAVPPSGRPGDLRAAPAPGQQDPAHRPVPRHGLCVTGRPRHPTGRRAGAAADPVRRPARPRRRPGPPRAGLLRRRSAAPLHGDRDAHRDQGTRGREVLRCRRHRRGGPRRGALDPTAHPQPARRGRAGAGRSLRSGVPAGDRRAHRAGPAGCAPGLPRLGPHRGHSRAPAPLSAGIPGPPARIRRDPHRRQPAPGRVVDAILSRTLASSATSRASKPSNQPEHAVKSSGCPR